MKELIIALCKERGIAVTRLEKELGLGHGTIAKWDKASPRIDTLKKVTDYFGISVCELLEKYYG